MMNLRSWQENFYTQLKPDSKNDANRIYANSILGAKISSLSITYDTIVILIGKTAFECIATGYLSEYTESPIDIGEIGAGFPDYLTSHEINSHLPYISDVARFDRIRSSVFEFKNDTDDCIISSYDYPVDHIWECCQKEYTGDFNIDIKQNKTIVMIYRIGLNIVIQRLNE